MDSFEPIPDDEIDRLDPQELTLTEILARQRAAITSEFMQNEDEDDPRIVTRNAFVAELPDAVKRIIALSRSGKESISLQASRYIIEKATAPAEDPTTGIGALIKKLTQEESKKS